VVFEVDPQFAEDEVSYETIGPIEGRPRKDQPFYYLFAESGRTPYIAYVSEPNLLADTTGEPVSPPQLDDMFERDESGSYRWRPAKTELASVARLLQIAAIRSLPRAPSTSPRSGTAR